MPIRSIADLRGAVGKDWNDVSDEDLIKSYADSVKLDPTSVARELGYDMGSGGVAAKRLTSSVSNYVGGLQGVGEEIAGAFGLTGAQSYLAEKRRANELQAQVASSRAKDMGAIESYKDVNSIGTGLNYLGGLAVQSAPYALEAITGGLEARALMGGTRAALSEARAALKAGQAAGDAAEVARATQAVKQAERSLNIGSEVGVAAQSYPSAVGDILGNQREQTGGKTDIGAAALYGVGYTGLNVIGTGGALGRGSLFRNTIDLLDRPGGIAGGLARAGATAVGTGVKEGLSETGQEMLNQAGRMAVDDKAQFFSQDAQNRYMESFVGGAALGGAMGGALGGYRRSEGYQAGGDIQQAFNQQQTGGTPITGQTPPAPSGTTVTAPPAPPSNSPVVGTTKVNVGGKESIKVNRQDGSVDIDGVQVVPPTNQTGAPITPPSAPAVVGGTTAVAQATQQQTQADLAAQQQQQIQDQREKVIDQFGLRGEKEGTGQFFNRPIFGPAINQVADALGPIAAKLDQQEAAVMDAIVQADKVTGGKLVNFKFNGDKIPQSVQKGVEAVLTVANKFQIGHVGSSEEAAQILNTLSQSAKGAELEQINAIHQVLTGKDTEGYVTAQAPKPTKGKSNAQQQQQQLPEQVPAGLGTVSEQGGTGQVDSGLTGLLQPGAVQPIGTGSDVGTAISQQAGQPSGEGIRTGPGIATDNGGNVNAQQVTGVPSETSTAIQDTVGGGQTSGQFIQANQSDVDRPVVQRRKRRAIIGAQQYAPGLQYYASDLSHISSPRRIEIIQQLLLSVLAPARDNTTPAETRAEIVRLALIEQFPMKEIAELTGIKLDTVSKQLQRMGIALKDGEFQVVRPLFAEKLVAQAEAFRSPEFPDGIGVEELKGLYATRYQGEEKPTGDLAEELEAGEQEGDRSKLLAEERFGGETGEGQSMGTIGSAGGSQGAVESDESVALGKIEKLQKQLDAAPDTDVAGKANLSKQLAAAWELYAKEQKDRAKTGETKVRYKEEKATELGKTETEGEEDAVQVESADEGDVQEPAGGGKEVGKANAEPKKPARARKAKAESKPAEEAKPEIKTPKEQWDALAEQFPQMPPYATLNKDEKIRWGDVAERGVANLAAANTILSTVVKAAPAEKVEAPAATGTIETVEQPKFGVNSEIHTEAPYLKADGHVLHLMVNDKIAKTFELVSQGLWNAFKGKPDAQENLLRNKDALEISDLAQTELSRAEYTHREFAPLSRMEQGAIKAINENNQEDIFLYNEGAKNMAVRPSIATLIFQAVLENGKPLPKSTLTDLVASGNTRSVSTILKYAPASMLEGVTIPKFGVTRAVKNPYTAAELMADIKNFIRADILGNKLIIVDSVSDLIRHPDADLRAVGKAVGDKGAYGVAANGKAYLIANRIEQGQGRAKFMHEVGAHLGLENLLPRIVYDKLASQIDTWAKADNGSVESKLAKAAQARVEAAQTSEEDRQSEMLAYFIEEAVQSGIDPTAAGKESAALQSWFRTLWAAFKVAIRRLGFKTETLTAQDIVNLAFGAARLEITGTWHGTAADFRKFNHAFMDSGEGAQAFGWGTYLAQKVGVAKGYWTEDVNRKTQGVKGLQIEPTNGVPLNRKEKMVLTQIEHGGVHHNGWKDELRNRYVPYWTKELAKAKDAYDWVKSGLPRGGRNNAEHYQGIISQLSELLSGAESLLAPGRAELRIEPKKVEGSLMRVDTSVSDNEIIDWDAPIADQPKIVKEFIKQIQFGGGYNRVGEWSSIRSQIKTGGDVYKALLAKFYKEAGNTGSWDNASKKTKLEIKKAVSQYLDAHGIKGHKFFDQLSREDTFNNTDFTKGNTTLSGIESLINAYFTPGEIVNGYGGADKVISFNPTNNNVKVISVDTNGNPRRGERERVHFTMPSFKELSATLQKRGYAAKPSNRTQNTVIYNDKNIFRVGSETAADKQRMKFGFVGLKGLAQRGMTPKEEGRFLNAKLMDATGELRSDIWYDTGWLRGADGQWRTEISDKDASLKAPLPNFGTGKLGDLLDHPTLYKLYPQLTGYTLVVDPKMEPNSAAFIPEQQEIRMAAVQNSPVTALLHEVQHAIQEIEGFGKGANPAEMDMFNVNAANKFAAASHVFGYVSPEAQEAIAKYRDAIEAKHLAVVARDTGDFKTVDEERAAVQRTMDTDKAARRALGEMLSVLGSTEGEFKERLYRMVSGEIEARDVEARRQYDDMLRRQVVPGEAEGFTPETQLVYDKASDSYMKFGVDGKTADQHAREQISKLPSKWQPAARTITTTLMHTLQKAGLASMITEDVINTATKYMKSAQNYLTAQYARQATRLAHELKIERILQQHDKLPENLKGTGRGSVNEYIHDSTREGLWGYYPDARMVGTTMAKIDPGFKARFDAFPAAAQKLIKDVFEQGHDSLVAKQKAVTDAINREYADRAADVLGDADLTAELNKEKNLRIARESKLMGLDGSKPYAYMGRYGDYVVVGKSAEYKHHEAQAKAGPMVKGEYVYGSESQKWLEDNRSNPAHYVVQFAETLAEADQIAEQLDATGNYDIAESFEKEPYSREGGEMFAAVARLRNLYERESDGDNPAAAKAIRNLLGDLYLHTVSEASARKSEFQRLNISGSDKDMMRNLATRGRADAHFLAALQHNDAISDAITDMRQERDRNRREATPYFNELLKRHANSMKYETPSVLASALQRMSTVWYLSTNPAFYLQQILQTGTISLPYMAGRLGYFRSARAIKLAYSDMATLVKGLGVSEHVDFDKAPADVRAMLNTLVGMGKIDIGIDSDSTARAGDTGVTAAVMQKLQGVNNRIETINRATAAIAAYRGYLERYKNNDTAAATKYAAEVVSNTHGSYDAFNTPRIMATSAGKVLLQFKRFQIIQISMLAKLLTTAFKGASAEEKTVARHSLAFIVGQMGVLGGLMAVPFAQQAASILSKIFGDPDEPDDWEFKLRRMIGDKAVADLLISGVPGAMGLDVSGKIGMGNVFSVLPFTNIDFTSRSGAEKVLVGLMGPTASLGLKFADGLGMMKQGDYYKGLEQMMPNGVASVMKAGRFANEGITMRNGDVVLKPEEISMLDAAFQAVGLPTNTITDRQFTQKVVKEFDQYYKQRDTEIKGDYVEASRKGDSAAMGDARDEWNKLQDSRVANGYKRQPFSDLYKAPMAAIKRERNVSGGVEFTKTNRQLIESLSTI